jgi:hypothetical protein
LTADNRGAKKPGAFLFVNAENMGGVYAAEFMPFVNKGREGKA